MSDTPVEIAEGCEVDPLAVLGEPTGRSISDHTLRIGRGARIRSFTVIYAGANIGSHLETGHHVVIREETLIGDNVSIWSHSYIDYGCRIGDDVRIHQGVYLAQNSVVEDGAFLAPHVAVANDRYPACPRCLHGPRIRRGARVGVGVILLPGVEVGEYSLVGSGAVVTRDIPPGSIVVGNPARVVENIDSLQCPRNLDDCPGAPGVARRLRSAESMQ